MIGNKRRVLTITRRAQRQRIPRLWLVSALATLVIGCTTFPSTINVGDSTEISVGGIIVSATSGFPGAISITFKSDTPLTTGIRIRPLASVIGYTSESQTEKVGEITSEVCTDDGVCILVSEAVYETREVEAPIKGQIELSKRELTLEPFASDHIGITIRNYFNANQDFVVRIRCVIENRDVKTHTILLIGEKLFQPAMY
jgi:hypothetical protein